MGVLEILGGTSLLAAIVFFCSKKAVEIVVAKTLEDYKAELSFNATRREKAELVAELLSEWVKKPMDKNRVNRLLWEASMWLPDQEAKDLNDLFAHKNKKTTKELIIKVRAVIQGKETELTANDITHFN